VKIDNKVGDGDMREENTFEILACSIAKINLKAGNAAKSAINQLMTLRNWAIGYYIYEYEQGGKDRAEYGRYLLKNLEEKIDEKGMNVTLFKACRQFYLIYPQIGSTVSSRLELEDFGKSSTVSNQFITNPELLVERLSFSHIREIMVLPDSFERFFYETECMKNAWSVRELRRQIKTNLYVRAGISKNPEKLLHASFDKEAFMTIKDPFTFEFLGLEAKEAVSESDLEQALMNHLQEFMLELGEGFCFEARQKRIVIDDKYYFIDLVFYNRLLHCNVIIELKNDEFKHEDLGQLNSYVGYYRKNEMVKGDNLPVGILLCTDKGSEMVEYALSGMDNQLFVSTYMLHLPDKRKLQEFMLREMKELGI
jgi:predicted nuclease of restriction endonuclease-like (RecB) superfamily